MVHGGESPTTVVDYTPHGCKHVQVTAGAHTAAHGLISEHSLETVGHLGTWLRDAEAVRLGVVRVRPAGKEGHRGHP